MTQQQAPIILTYYAYTHLQDLSWPSYDYHHALKIYATPDNFQTFNFNFLLIIFTNNTLVSSTHNRNSTRPLYYLLLRVRDVIKQLA